MTVKTRFAPSPTGYLHIGGVRTALFSWAFARHHKGEFLLRIEDTDLARSTTESVNIILDGMKWVGLDYDNADNVVYQTRRFDRYKEIIAELLEKGAAYYCYCSKEELEAMREKAEKEGTATYDRRWRPEAGKTLPEIPADVQPVVRFKTPLDGVTKWTDLVKGEISIPNEALDDLIIARADGTPTYNFCVVVDDYDMGVTHVIRGDDHVNNTPKQINILKAIGANLPEYGHLPMILNEQGKKISKRSGDTVAITDFGAMGILPEAMLNYLARLGWAHGGAGGEDLARKVVAAIDSQPANFSFAYDTADSIPDKLRAIATKIYGASDVEFSAEARAEITSLEKLGLDKLPVCVAKTQYSFSDNPKLLGCPSGFTITVRSLTLSAGAGFIVAVCGSIMKMPGLPKVPSAEKIDVDVDGNITGLF